MKSSKSFYRTTYLRSDHWKDLRLRKLVQQDGRCLLCNRTAYNNDVHHINYRRLYDVRMEDLKVLCRECHDAVHEVMDKRPELKSLHPHIRWSRIRRALWKTYTVWRIIPRIKSEIKGMHKAYLKAARQRLFKAGIICDWREMPLKPHIYRMMQKVGYKTDMDILMICLRMRYQFYPHAQCGEH